MLPPRARRPTVPVPGSHRSQVFVEHHGVGRGHDRGDALLRHCHPSHEPDAVHARFGRADRVRHDEVRRAAAPVSCSFTVCENIAAVLENEKQRRHVDIALHLLERVGEGARHCVAGDAHHVDAVLLDAPPRLFGIELVDEHRGVALAGDAEDQELPGAVHERRDREHRDPLRRRRVDLLARLGRRVTRSLVIASMPPPSA